MPRSTPNQIYKVVKTADNRLQKKDYKKSLAGYNKALTMKPNKDIESYCYRKIGISQQELENYGEALNCFDKSLSIQKSFEAFFYKGILLLHLGKYKESEDNLKQALKNNTNDGNAVITYINLGRVYLIQSKTKDAIKVLRNALDIKSNDLNALLLLAETYKQMKEVNEAKELYEKILSLKQNKDAVIGLATIYLEDNDQQKAISLLKIYLQDHQDPELFQIKGEIHFNLNDFENALANFKKARKLQDSEQLVMREARCLITLQKPEEAIEEVQKFCLHNKESMLAKIFLAELYARTKENSQASEVLNELIQTDQRVRKNPDAAQAVAHALLLNNEYEKAEELYLHANELGLHTWEITKQLTIIALDQNRFEVALERIEKLFSLAENASQIGHSYYLQAFTYFRQEMYNEAIDAIDKGLNDLKKSKNDQYYILLLLKANAKLKLNLESETEELVNSIIKENPQMKSVIESDSELSTFLK